MSYSWLSVPPPKQLRVPLSKEQKKRLSKEQMQLGKTFHSLEKKLERYQDLCERFSDSAGTKKGERTMEQMTKLRYEIENETKALRHTLKDTYTLTHEER